jgi:hypothetical protein
MVLVPEGMPLPTPLARRQRSLAQGIRVAQFLDELGVFHGATCDRIDDSIGDMAKYSVSMACC